MDHILVEEIITSESHLTKIEKKSKTSNFCDRPPWMLPPQLLYPAF